MSYLVVVLHACTDDWIDCKLALLIQRRRGHVRSRGPLQASVDYNAKLRRCRSWPTSSAGAFVRSTRLNRVNRVNGCAVAVSECRDPQKPPDRSVWLARICLVAADDEAECAGEMGQMGVT